MGRRARDSTATGRFNAWRCATAAACLILVVLVELLATPTAAGESREPVVLATRLAGDEARTRFIADLDTAVGFSAYIAPDPFRVIVDIPEVNFHLPPGIGDTGRGLIQAYRYGRIDAGRSRIVMDATGPILIERSFVIPAEDGQPARLVVDLVKTDRQTFLRLHQQEQAQQQASAEQEKEGSIPEDLAPAGSLGGERSPAAATGTPLPRPKPSGDMQLASADPLPATTEEKKPRRRAGPLTIVLDPGHGGIDPGAVSRDGTNEKTVVLAFAKALKERLESTGRYRVVMTRSDDTFLSLAERVRIARRNQADLFIAIHADTLRAPSVRGATVYTVSEKASDAEAEALANKENRADIIAGADLSDEKGDIADILIDLAQRETKNHSAFFAKTVVGALHDVTLLTGQPHRSAGFRVLKAPDIPSVLIELGYLSSKSDVALLVSSEWRGKVAKALTAAVDSYFRTTLASGK